MMSFYVVCIRRLTYRDHFSIVSLSLSLSVCHSVHVSVHHNVISCLGRHRCIFLSILTPLLRKVCAIWSRSAYIKWYLFPGMRLVILWWEFLFLTGKNHWHADSGCKQGSVTRGAPVCPTQQCYLWGHGGTCTQPAHKVGRSTFLVYFTANDRVIWSDVWKQILWAFRLYADWS